MKTQTRTYLFRLLLAFGLVVTLAAASFSTARAFEVDKSGKVSEGQVVNDDLLLAGDTVTMAGTVNGTLFAAGQQVIISGTVNGDVFAAGSNISVTGTVQGNLFVVGGRVTVSATVENSLAFAGSSFTLEPTAKVEGNLYAAGANITLETGSTIGKDAAMGGYQLILQGSVGRDVHAAAEAFQLDGSVGRDVSVYVGDTTNGTEIKGIVPFQSGMRFLTPGLTISSGASIGGKLDYYSAVDQTSGIAIVPAGGVQYHYTAHQTNTQTWNGPSFRLLNFNTYYLFNILGAIREFLTLLLLGALAMWLIPTFLPRAAIALRTKPLPSLGWGFLLLIAGVVALITCAVLVLVLGLAVGVVTLFGLMAVVFGLGFSALGFSGTVFMVLAQFGSKLVVALLIGDWLIRLMKKDYKGNPFWTLLLGVLLITIFDALPCFGWLFGLLAIIFGFGAICISIREWWQRRKTAV